MNDLEAGLVGCDIAPQEGRIVPSSRISTRTRRWLAVGALAIVAANAGAPVAAADLVFPSAGSESVGATVDDLKAQGYNVVVNFLEGQPNVALSACTVIGIDDPSPPTADPATVTVSVDVECPNAK